MSKQVDERVVSMQFDNQHFERNVATTMSTLDKLKLKLHLPGAKKGLEDVNAAAKKVDMSPLGHAVDTVGIKFNAMHTIADQALRNITNSAMAAGKKIVSALTIDPVKTGFQEYETQINAVQTILANTESKGTTIDDVNVALEELNKYADKTIYNFTEMTRNIGTFTAAGVDLDTSVNAIQGIANLAAVSGSTSQQAATAMYQLSQALSSGTVKLMDWNSVVNAGMGGEVFQNALKETARVHGVAIDDMIESQGSFRETLKDGWLTSEILTETLSKFTMATEGLTEAEIEANRVKLRSMGYTDEQIDGIFKLGNTATNAATKVKTFTQLWDVMKESAQSGWAQSWKIIIGDFEEAKSLLTPLADFFTNAINGMSEARNKLLEGALGNPFTKKFTSLVEKIKQVTGATEGMASAFKALKDPAEVVDSVIRGDWGHMQERWDKLTEAGYDWVKVQNLVNEKLGSSFRRTEKEAEAQTELNNVRAQTIEQLLKLSDAELKSLGFTDEEIKGLRELAKQAEKTGIPLEELVKDIDQLNGRTLLINAFKNIGQSLVKIFKAIKDAWRDIFPPMTSERLYNLIAAFHKFSINMKMSDETADKLKRTFKGLFAALDIILTVIGTPLKIAFKILVQLLGMFNIDILDATAYIGDAIVAFRDWIDSVLDCTKIFEKIMPAIMKVVDGIKVWIKGLKETDNIPKYIIQGLVNGLFNGVKLVAQAMMELGKTIINTIKAVLGIHSPSTEFFEVGKNIIQGLINGIKSGVSLVWDLIKSIGTKAVDIIKKIDFGQIFAGAITGGSLLLGNKTLNVVSQFAAPFASFGDMLEDLGQMFEGIGSYFKGAAMNQRSKAILNLAKAILILVGALLLLTLVDPDKLWNAIVSLGALVLVVGALAAIAKLLGSGGGKFGVASLSLIALSTSLLIMAIALRSLTSINIDDVPKVLGLLAGTIALLAIVMIAFGKVANPSTAANMGKAGKILTKMAIAMLIMIAVIKLASLLDKDEVSRGLAVVTMVGLLFAGIIAVSFLAGQYASKAGGMLLKISFAMLIMVGVIKLAGRLDGKEIFLGLAVVTMVGVLFTALIAVSKLAGQHASKAGTMLLMMSVAFLIMMSVIKQASDLDGSALTKGLIVVLLLGTLFAALVAVSKFAGQNAAKAGFMLLAMSFALMIVAATIFVVSLLDPAGLARGLAAITLLGGLFAGLIAITKIAQAGPDMEKTLTRMIIAIAVLAAAIVALSFLDPAKLTVVSAALSLVVGLFAGLIAATKLAKNTKSMRKTLLQLLGVTIVLAGVIAAMTLVDPTRALASATALSLLLGAFASAMTLLGAAGKVSASVKKALLPMLGVVAGLALILGLMSAFDVEASIPTAIALGILLNALAAAMVILKFAGKASMGAVATMAVMALVVGELALILGLMSYFDVNPSMETALALSTLLLSLSAALVIISTVGPLAGAAIGGVLAMAALVVVLGGLLIAIGALVDYFPSLETFLDKGVVILEKIGYAIGSFFGNIVGGFVGGISNGFPELGENLGKFMENAKPFIEGMSGVPDNFGSKVSSLAGAILALTAAELLAGIATFVSNGGGFARLGADLSAFIVNAMPFIIGASTIDPSSMKGVKTLADTILVLTGAQLLEGIASWVTGESSLSAFAKELKPFGEAIVEFSNTVKGKVDEEAVNAAANSGKVLAELADNIPASGTSFLSVFVGNQDLGVFGDQIVAFGKAIVNFSDTVKGKVDEEAVAAAANAGKLMSELANGLPSTNWNFADFFAGGQDIGVFGQQLEVFGTAMVNFSKAVSADGAINPEAIQSAANACELMSTIAHGLPSTNWNFADFFAGGVDIGDFGEQLALFGPAMAKFSKSVSGENKIDEAAVTSAANACKMFVEIANAIPATGGISTWWEDIDLYEFGEDLAGLGGKLYDFNGHVKNIDKDRVSIAAEATKLMAEAAKVITQSGVEDGRMWEFGEDLAGLGGKLYDFNGAVKDINVSHIYSVASTALPAIANAVKALNGTGVLGDSGKLYTFGSDLAGFGGKLYDFNNHTKDIDPAKMNSVSECIRNVATSAKTFDVIDAGKMKASAEAVKEIGKSIRSIAGIDSTSTDGFRDSMESLAMVNIEAFTNAFSLIKESMTDIGSNATSGFVTGVSDNIPKVTQIGSDMMSKFIKAIGDQGSKAKIAFNKIILSCVTAVTTHYNTFYSAGGSLVSGFASGISANSYKAEAKARAMAKAAADAAEDELDINSPSKVFRAIGTSVPEGFAQGIDKLGNVVTSSSRDMADSAILNVKDAVSRMAEVMDSDIDSQPTIRPVLDLSNVEAGASAIGGLLGGNRTLALNTSSVGALSASMNKLQNGRNSDELLSTMKGLRKDIANMPRNSYNLNGINYEEGDDVAEALKTIVRAARVERRK